MAEVKDGDPLEPQKGRAKKAEPAKPLDPVEAFLEVLERATPGQRSRIAQKMGISESALAKKRKRKQRVTNDQIRQFVMANGDVIHSDPDFLPIPPEAVSSKGQAAIDAYHEKWLDGKTLGERGVSDLDHLADEAKGFQAEMERRIDAGEFEPTGV